MCNVKQKELTSNKVLGSSVTIVFIFKDCQLALTISVSQFASVGGLQHCRTWCGGSGR